METNSNKWLMIYHTRRRTGLWNKGEPVWMLRWIELEHLSPGRLIREQVDLTIEQIYIEELYNDSGFSLGEWPDDFEIPFERFITFLISEKDLDNLIGALRPWRPRTEYSDCHVLSTDELITHFRLKSSQRIEIEVGCEGYIRDIINAGRSTSCGCVYVPREEKFFQSNQIRSVIMMTFTDSEEMLFIQWKEMLVIL